MSPPQNLRCEALVDPLGVDQNPVRLSWELALNGSRGLQDAYQIQVATRREMLESDQPDLWDSGKIVDSRNHMVPYGGAPLESLSPAYWRVRFWNSAHQSSEWSSFGYWCMGRIHSEDWAPAKWIGLDRPDPSWNPNEVEDLRKLAARYLRREITLPAGVARAVVTLAGLGVYDLHVNGKRVTESEGMNQSQTDFRSRVMYQTYNLTECLTEGSNTLGVVLGNGRFQGLRPCGHRIFGFPKLLLRLDIQLQDGSSVSVVSDESWKVTDQGPIRSNHEYDGEVYDARMEMPGWDQPNFEPSNWDSAEVVEGPGGTLEAQAHEPTRIVRILKPIECKRHDSGVWLLDFGHVSYGHPLLSIRANAGHEVSCFGAYSLRPDGRLKTEDNRGARVKDVYICSGIGRETWAPRFRAQGTRWLEVHNWPDNTLPENIQLRVIEHDCAKAGAFACSEPLVQGISDNVRRGVRAFLRQGLPMEPDRDERQPWLGDPACGVRSYAAEFNVASVFRKWLGDIRAAQTRDGNLPAIAPMFWTFDCQTDPVWPAVITILPLWHYRQYGDPVVLSENFSTAVRWVRFLEKGMLPDGTTDAAVYGDWCDTASMDELGTDHGATSLPLIGSAYLCLHARHLAEWAKLLNLPEAVEEWTEKARLWKEAFNQRFFDPATCSYQSDTQCAMLLPLAFDLVPREARQRVIDRLVHNILVKSGGHTTVGLIGNQWLLPTLSALGRPDVAYHIVTRRERPSWGYMLQHGATTIWERWDANTRGPGMNSEALLIQAGPLGAWFVETLAGITPSKDAVGFNRILMKPFIPDTLKWVEAEQMTPQGMVRSAWKRDQDKLQWNVSIPPNTTAEVHFPGKVHASGQITDCPASGIPKGDDSSNCALFGPGEYSFTVHLPGN